MKSGLIYKSKGFLKYDQLTSTEKIQPIFFFLKNLNLIFLESKSHFLESAKVGINGGITKKRKP